MHLARSSWLALLLLPSVAAASVPSPSNSTVPTCFVACPLGDIPSTITVRDIANNPVTGSTVVLDFSQCASVYLCAGNPNDPIHVDLTNRTVSGVTNTSGQVTFPLHAGGFCSGGLRVFADGVMLAQRTFKSPDQDGDGVVMPTDATLFSGKVGTADASADFDCSGLVDNADLLVMNAHGAHACDGIVLPARPRSWGALKLLYR